MKYDTFSPTEYIKELTEKCKFAVDNNFRFCRISGMQGMEEVVENVRNDVAFVAIDDTAESTMYIRESGPVETVMYTVFVLHRYDFRKQSSRIEAEKKCHDLMRMFFSRMLHDRDNFKDALIYLDEDVQLRNVGTILTGVTGYYFTFSFGKPTSLVYDKNEWMDSNA